jgi:hypothetical protein
MTAKWRSNAIIMNLKRRGAAWVFVVVVVTLIQ